MKLGQVGSKIRLQGQILEKPCVHSREHRCNPKFMKLCHMLIIIISRSGSKLGYVGSKTGSLGQILEKPFVHSKVHSFISSPELAQGELLGYCDVRRPCGRP